MTRRKLPQNPPIPLPVNAGKGGVADCLNGWRQDMRPLVWDDILAAAAYGWCWELWARGERHDLTARGECYALNQPTWIEAVHAWINSPPHLKVIRDDKLIRVGCAGLRQGTLTFWVLRFSDR